MPQERAIYKPEKPVVVFSTAVVSLLCTSLFLTLLPLSLTTAEPLPSEETNHSYTINTSVMDNLNLLTGKRVTIFLDGGHIFTGIVKSAGAHLIYMEKTERKKAFDVLIKIERIQAIEVQSKEHQQE